MDKPTNETAPSTPLGARTEAPSTPVDVERVVAEALAGVQSVNDIATQAISSGADMDFEAMERQIQALLGGQGDAVEETAPAPMPEARSSPDLTPDIRNEALEAEPVDPLIKEIDAALSDDADALLKGANGDVGQALRSVFDERALSGQEEEINRALIEAFGSSRVAAPSFSTPQVTNPLPGFEGSARPISPNIPRAERDRAANPTDIQPAQENTSVPAAPQQANAPVFETVAATAPTVASPSNAPNAPTAQSQRSVAVEAKPAEIATAVSSKRSLLERLALVVSAPMRAMPETGRLVVSLAAITLALWTPVAWWLAHRATQTPAVAPIVIKPAPAVVAAEPAKSDAGGSGH
ncbi:MAG: hypothetical protein RIT24_2483 [Planctomycetota bacterium]|jgi:hypothetical protein